MFRIYTFLFVLLLTCSVTMLAWVQFYSSNEMSQKVKNGSNNLVKRSSDSLGQNKAKVLFNAINKKSLWELIRARLQLMPREENRPAVQKQIRWFVKNPAYLSDAISRAAPYIGYVYTQVAERNLPTELVLLPIIESGYNPSAINPESGATGMWQLMSSTAHAYGAHQDKGFDGRRDLYSSTNAALNYLTYLKSFFSGDWLLAIAAYDTGEGNVQNAIRHNSAHDKNTHFWALPLALETRSYIPRLLALAAIIKDPAKYGVILPPINPYPYFELVSVGKTKMSLRHAAQLADMDLFQLRRLNPGIKNSKAVLTQGQFVLPIDRIALYKTQLNATLHSENMCSNKQDRYREKIV